MIPLTLPHQHPDLDADILNYYANPQDLLAADRQLLHRPISKILRSRRSTKSTKWNRSIDSPSTPYDRTSRQHTIRHFFDRAVPSPGLIDTHAP